MNDRSEPAASRDVAYVFDEFRLEPGRRRLTRYGELVPVAPKVLDTLVELIRRRGEVVSKDALMRAIWGGAVVEENNLNQNISALRRALQDQRGANRYIVTHPGRGYAFVGDLEVGPTAPFAEDGTTTLAVLPFANLSGEPEREYFADGLTEETISALGQLDPRRLNVLARSAVMPYKHAGADFTRIGRELGAAYIVEGSLRAEGNVLRTTARLIRTRDRKQLWSASFDGEPASVLEFQRELAHAIANQVRLGLEPSRLVAMEQRQSRSADAFDYYLRGRHAWHRLTPPTMRHALEMYGKATALDADYALAWSGIADAYSTGPIAGDADPAVVGPLAGAAVAEAVRARPDLAETQTSVGFYKYYLEWDWAGSEEALLRAIELDPAYSAAWRILGQQYGMMGRFDDAYRAMRRARELDPFLAVHHALSGQVAFAARDHEACLRFARQALALDPDFWIGHLQCLYASEQLGDLTLLQHALEESQRVQAANSKLIAMRAYAMVRLDRAGEARAMLGTLEQLARERYVPPCVIALVHLALGDREAALHWVERGVAVRDIHLFFLHIDPKWAPVLHEDPRFQAQLALCAFRRLQQPLR